MFFIFNNSMKCFGLIFILTTFTYILADIPCAERRIPNESVVCVCNTSYCDDITREIPLKGAFVTYTSSKDGLRFKKDRGTWNVSHIESCCLTTLELFPTIKYQIVEGFGGAVTDSAAINWKTLPLELQDYLIRSYFSKNGLEYNMLRVPIGGTDFSTHAYAYNESPENDTHLSNYKLAPEDTLYKIPMIKSIMQVATAPVHIVATTWSPPLWMKTHQTYGGYSRLKRQYYQTYADYHLKFIEQYNQSGIPVWGITTTNEPINGLFSLASFNSLGWDITEMGEWILNNLGPTIRKSAFKDLKLLAGDDQRATIPYWFNVMFSRYPKALDYIDGIAVHYYTDKFVPAAVFKAVTLTHPDKIILSTEACEGSFPWQKEKVLLGSWDRAKSYIEDILEDLNYNLVGWIDWNLCLNMGGGPNWAANYVDSPIIVDKDKQEFLKQPMYYAMGHFSKFIPRDSIRIKVLEKKHFFTSHLRHVAFVTPKNTIVVVVYNDGQTRSIRLKNRNKQATLNLKAHSVTTIEFLYE
ncbi:lysosomal acid glucosylceramidase-like isoform X2 [Nymphalis io]|uniref:lysosomal acid glucosylceramidase-like isoform X2 n=1 Tax=Inachis io TaxID=171585 RepID=UPI002168E0D8|nr:lysosomal acid glucosylceramidase-like isoform X2 [Nymphalis io]